MNLTLPVGVIGCAALFAGLGLPPSAARAQSYSQFHVKLPMTQRSAISGIEGRLDHLAYDPKSGVLYVACRRAGSIECMDPTGMKVAQSIKDVPEPSGMVFVVDQRRLAAACADGKVRIFKADDAGALTPERTVEFRGETDNIRYDAKAKSVFVGYQRYICSFDPASGEKGTEIELPGIPEGFVIEEAGPRLFVNIAKKGQIAVVNRTTGKVIETWTLKDETRGNYAMAADQTNEGSGRLFIAARSPAQLIVLDMKDGREVARVDTGTDSDDAWYDAKGKRIYVSCGGGGGKVTMILQDGLDTYTLEHNEGTAPGAATSLLIPERRRLIVASPKSETYTFLFIYLIPP